jgi:hypothetical protein
VPDIEIPTGALALSEENVGVAFPGAETGALALAGSNVGVAFQGAETGAAVLQGLTATLGIGAVGSVSITVPTGSIAFSGTLLSVAFLDPNPAQLTLQGYTPSLVLATGVVSITVPVAALTLSGKLLAVTESEGVSTGRPTVEPTLELLVDGIWIELTDDLVNEPLRWSRGIFGAGPMDQLARPGTLTFALDNTDTNSVQIASYYSPGHPDCMYGFRHGAVVRLSLSDGTVARYVFRGRLRSITPDPSLYGLRMSACLAMDWLHDFAGYDAGQLDLQEDVRSDELLTALIDSLPTQPSNVDIDMGLDSYEFAVDDLGGTITKATQVAQDILQSERGYLYLRGDDTEGETLRFENRHARAAAAAVAVFDEDDLFHTRETIVVPSDTTHIFNDVEVLTVPRRVDENPVVLVNLSAPIEVAPGATEQVFVDYLDPDNESEYVGGKDMIQPAATTDYTANDARDGTGADITTSVTVSAVYWGSRCMIEITNTGASTAYVRGPGAEEGLHARGYGLYRYRPEGSRSTNASSITLYGSQQLPSPLLMPYQGDRNIGQGVAAFIVHVYGGLVKVPTQVMVDTFSSQARTSHGITRDIGDSLALTEEGTGVDEALVFIHGLSQELGVDGLLRTTWFLSPGDITDVLILDDPERGLIDDDNVLAYA